MTWYGDAWDSLDRSKNEFRDVDPNGNIAGQAGASGAFADQAQQGFQGTGAQMQGVANQLQRQASGQDSLSQVQLGQALGQNLAAQRSMAASAAPQNQAMAARTAAIQGGRLGSALAGQQATAGIQERSAANQQLGALLGGMRGQDLQAALGGRQNALSGYGDIEQARGQRFGGMLSNPTGFERLLGAGIGAAGVAISDRRLKTDIKDGDEDAAEFLQALKAYRFSYKDEKHGKGEQLGIMAQDLSKSRLGRQAVIETSEGKAVHGAKLATALAAAASQMNRRLSKLEGKR